MSDENKAQTVRQAILDELSGGLYLTINGLSVRLGITQKEVVGHLEHIRKSLKAKGRKLEVEPPRCLLCGFVFEGRERFTKPGKCPECHGTRIDDPAVHVDRET